MSLATFAAIERVLDRSAAAVFSLMGILLAGATALVGA